jgi:GT2 family glycosyltransferase
VTIGTDYPGADVSQPTAFVIILNWNLKDDTIACAESVLAGSYARQRVVVVDNGSQDGSVSALTDRFGEAIDLIANEENVGFARGINVGIRHALAQGADWVLLLNNDTTVAPDMIERLMAVANRQAGAGILAPAIFYYDQPERVWRLGDRHHRWLPIPLKIPARNLKAREVLPVDYVTGCGMLIRRQVFSVIGLFDPQYFMYYEDADFCMRAAKADFAIVCVPAARMWHKVSHSTRRDVSRQRYLKTRYRVQFYRHHYSLPAWVYLILSILWMTLKDLLRGDRQAAWACVRGFYHGWWPSAANEPT